MPMICIDENFMKEYMLGEKVIYDNCGKTDSFIKTGVTEIDERCGGLQRGYTYLITSRPGMGKTAFVFNIWAHLLKDTSHFYRTVIFSPGRCKEQVVNFLACIMGAEFATNGNYQKIQEQEKYQEILEKISMGFSCIDDTPGLSMESIYRSCKTVEGTIDLIIIDDLQLVDTKECGNTYERLSAVLDDAKKIAMEFNCTVIMTSQFPGNVENRINHRPTLDDLVRQDMQIHKVNHIWAIYRDDYYYMDTEMKGLAEIISLSPMQEVFNFYLAWIPQNCKFANLTRTIGKND